MINRFARRKEIEEQYKRINKVENEEEIRSGGYEASSGIVISQNEDKLFVDDKAINNIVFGNERSGKGKYFILPNLDIYSRAKEKPSIIVHDPTTEIYNNLKKKLENRGYIIEILDLENTELSTIKYNPIKLIIEAYRENDLIGAYFLANGITDSIYGLISGDSYWNCSIKNLASAMILGTVEDYINENNQEEINLNMIGNILYELASKESDGKNGLEIYFDKFDKNSKVRELFDKSNFHKSNIKDSLLTEVVMKLKISNLNLGKDMDFKSIGFKSDKDKPFAIFLKSDEFQNRNNPIVSIFVNQLYYILSKEASKCEFGKCEREIIFMIDEFNNIPEISNLEKMLAIGGSKNIKFNLTLQRIGQLKRKYGERYKQILSNCTNKFYLCSSDIETVEYFYEEIGYLKNKMQLMNLKEDELLIVRSNKRDCNNKIEPYPIYNKAENTYKYEYEK